MNYLQEWGASCVDEQLTRLNVIPLEGPRPYDYLFYAHELPRRNDGRVRDPLLRRYQHLEAGGWWCSGIDVLTGTPDPWGCFKPSQPRRSPASTKLIKYEHPPQAPTSVFALRIPRHLWQRIATRYQLEILPTDIDPKQPDQGFWQWLIKHPTIPLCITEGAKKAGALITAGYAAIGVPGIHSGYRVPKDEQGNRIGKSYLIPQLLKFAQPQRQIYFVFDQDTKPTTIKAVETAIRKTGYLFSQQGCHVKVITWKPELGKGVDDLIAQGGHTAFDQVYETALPLEICKAQRLTQLTYSPDIRLNCRYLPHPLELVPGTPLTQSSALQLTPKDHPDHKPEHWLHTARLIAIKSPKGTGKTKFLESVVAEALSRDQWVLVIGHRVQLVEALCQRFGLNYITEVKHSETGTLFGYGLCIDSLHPNSQAQFHGDQWSDGVVIIDEVEQVLWHGLNSSTCRHQRVAILKSLKTLMQNILGGAGQVVITDADLSDVSINYLIALAGVAVEPLIIENEWQPTPRESWQVYSYPDNTPQRLVTDLETHIAQGGKPFVCLSAQKLTSQWGTRALEAYLTQKFPDRKILRIDAESLAEPSHPAYHCITNLNQVLANYDIVLASPAIETGVSIELRNHFTSVWGIAQGIQSENSVRQALGRIRQNLPRYLWVAPLGFNQVGNGSTSIPALLTSEHRLTQLNIRLLQQSDFEALDDLDMGFQAESLLCWAQMAVRFNAAMLQYREAILTALVAEGHQVQIVNPLPDIKPANSGTEEKSESNPCLTEVIATVRQQNYQAECQAISHAMDLSDRDYQDLQKQMSKTLSQRHAQRKHQLKLRYGVPVTPELIIKDDQGWFEKLQLHYFLTVGRSYLAERDADAAAKLMTEGRGNIFLPDFNSSQLGAVIGIMDVLGIHQLITDKQRELRNTDQDLQTMATLALGNRPVIKTTLNIGLAANSTPITILRRFLDKIGYGLTCLRSETRQKKRLRVYQIVDPEDGRSEVFQQWLAFDYSLKQEADQRRERKGFHGQHFVGACHHPDYIQLSLCL